MPREVEHRGPDLFQTPHTDLESDRAVDRPINLTSASVGAEAEDASVVTDERSPNADSSNSKARRSFLAIFRNAVVVEAVRDT